MNSNKMKSSYAFEVPFAFDYKRKRFNSHNEHIFFTSRNIHPTFTCFRIVGNGIFQTFIRIRILNQSYVYEVDTHMLQSLIVDLESNGTN